MFEQNLNRFEEEQEGQKRREHPVLLHFRLRVPASLSKNQQRVALTQNKHLLVFLHRREKEKVEKAEVDNKEAVAKGEKKNEKA